MGRLGCNCGATMSNVDCPSLNIIHIFEEKEVDKALEDNPSIRLWDFRSMRRKYEYWYCSDGILYSPAFPRKSLEGAKIIMMSVAT